jgi:tRNA pseudouridine13 synthase
MIGASLERLDQSDGLRVLAATPHHNKLKRGHLAGNRFDIAIRDTDLAALVRAKTILERLAACGVPNAYGPQRFGFRRNGHLLGRHLLLGQPQAFIDEMLARPDDHEDARLADARQRFRDGDLNAAIDAWPRSLPFDRQLLDALRKGKPPADAVASIGRDHRRLLLSALQSAVFNRVLADRMAAGTFDRLVPGDLAWLHDRGAVFAVDPAAAETDNAPTGRVPALAVSPSGPMWGPGMTRAAGRVDDDEVRAGRGYGLGPDDWSAERAVGAIRPEGARRPLRIPLRDPSLAAGADEHGPYLRVAFTLPRGAFATVVCRELMKNDAPG